MDSHQVVNSIGFWHVRFPCVRSSAIRFSSSWIFPFRATKPLLSTGTRHTSSSFRPCNFLASPALASAIPPFHISWREILISGPFGHQTPELDQNTSSAETRRQISRKPGDPAEMCNHEWGYLSWPCKKSYQNRGYVDTALLQYEGASKTTWFIEVKEIL